MTDVKVGDDRCESGGGKSESGDGRSKVGRVEYMKVGVVDLKVGWDI